MGGLTLFRYAVVCGFYCYLDKPTIRGVGRKQMDRLRLRRSIALMFLTLKGQQMNVAMLSQDNNRRVLRPYNAFHLFLVGLMLTAVGSQQQTAVAQDATAAIETLMIHVVDVNGMTPTDPNTLIWRNYDPREMITAPDGRQLTLSEFRATNGEVRLESKTDGTEVSMQLTGLIPNGTYTAWGFYFGDPAYNSEMPNFGMRAGGGSIGNNLGTQNLITVDGDGNGTFLLTHPAGPVSLGSPPLEAPLYALDGTYANFVVVGAYHYDNLTYGPTPGPGHAAQFAAVFVPEPSSIALAFFAATGFAVFRPRRRKSSLAEPTSQLNR